jgi:hypothetical protein
MSRSYHETFSQLKGQTKKELIEMTKDPDSILSKLGKKMHVKEKVKKERKELKIKKGLSDKKDI